MKQHSVYTLDIVFFLILVVLYGACAWWAQPDTNPDLMVFDAPPPPEQILDGVKGNYNPPMNGND